MRKISFLLLFVFFSFAGHAALVINCPTDTTVAYQSGCQFTLGDYTSRVIITQSDGPTFVNQNPVAGTVITSTAQIEIIVTDSAGNVQNCRFNVVLPPLASLTLTPNPTFCSYSNDGGVISSVSGGTPPFSYTWTNGATTSSISNVAPGTYGLTITDANGCTTLEETTVTAPSELELTGTALTYTGSSNVSYEGASDGKITTSATGGTPPYFWQWDNDAIGAVIDSLPVGTYKVVVTDQNGCVDTMAFTLIPPFSIVIPPGFSPNGDGINDTFVIKNLKDYPDNELSIFNRWGEEVYHAKPYANEWDGKNHNSNQFLSDELPDGTYYYYFRVNGVKLPTLKGYIVLKRK